MSLEVWESEIFRFKVVIPVAACYNEIVEDTLPEQWGASVLGKEELMNINWRRIDWLPIILGLSVFGVLAQGYVKDENDPERQKLIAAIENRGRLERLSAEAEKLWPKCNFVKNYDIDEDGNEYFARLREGEVVRDDISNEVLPDDMVVCSTYGDVGVVRDGKVSGHMVYQGAGRVHDRNLTRSGQTDTDTLNLD